MHELAASSCSRHYTERQREEETAFDGCFCCCYCCLSSTRVKWDANRDLIGEKWVWAQHWLVESVSRTFWSNCHRLESYWKAIIPIIGTHLSITDGIISGSGTWAATLAHHKVYLYGLLALTTQCTHTDKTLLTHHYTLFNDKQMFLYANNFLLKRITV